MSDTLPAGNAIYQEIHNGMCIQGISYSEDDLNQSAQIVADICFDSLGKKDFEDYLLSLSDTGFRKINAVYPTIRDWQVGEGFAEAYLTAHFSCFFPWSNNRDLKNPNSSLTGADLVGFHQGQFAFGEVKTSTELKYPPQVTSKKDDGLNTQLKKLCHNHDIRWVLIQYLFHRMKGKTEYREACISYLKDNKNFYVFGALVRNVEPNINDWNYLKKHLEVHEQNRVSLVALYLPQNDGIQTLHACMLSKGAKS
ncbi:MAG: hypothetical protein E4G94_00875 [ANME-2 cluster archaeon]|nr:MAG: hypothetical protein E4G94_00875 [ANME-2 cluster archaeon]